MSIYIYIICYSMFYYVIYDIIFIYDIVYIYIYIYACELSLTTQCRMCFAVVRCQVVTQTWMARARLLRSFVLWIWMAGGSLTTPSSWLPVWITRWSRRKVWPGGSTGTMNIHIFWNNLQRSQPSSGFFLTDMFWILDGSNWCFECL